MNLYITEIKAKGKTWCGPNVPGISAADAEAYCQNNGLGYCEVVGELVAEIPTVNGNPDFNNEIDYENQNLN